MNNFREAILNKNFEEAETLLSENPNFDEQIIDYAFEDENEIYYEFYKYLLKKKNTDFIHWAASKLLSTAFCYIDNAYQTAYNHLKQAITLAPENYDYIANHLYYYGLPLDTPLITKKELMDILLQLKLINNNDSDIDKFENEYLNESEKNELKARYLSINK